jgi:serine/threonine-protein kinase
MKVCPKCGKQFGDDNNFCPSDAGKLQPVAGGGAPATDASNDLVGGRFQLGERIGGGVTGEIFRAGDNQQAQQVAVKLVAPAVAAIPQVATRAERELKQLERVGSKAIAKVLASGRQGQQLWIATELVEGGLSLSDVVAARGALDPHRASELVVAIGEALIEAAKVGVVHRDLAPKNVLLAGDQVKIINFCLPVPTSDKVPGVPEYVAPELIEGKPIDQRSNIYSLGAMFYFLLTGASPFEGSPEDVHKAHLAGAFMPPSKRAPVPADLDGLVAKAMERAAAKRYLTLRQFLDEVARVANGPQGGVAATQPFGAAGKAGGVEKKPSHLASTLMGVAPASGAQAMPTAAQVAAAAAMAGPNQNEIKTRQMDVQIPPEALREAIDAGLIDQHAPAVQAAPAAPVLPAKAAATAQMGSQPSPWAAPAQAAAPVPAAPVVPQPMPAPAPPVVAAPIPAAPAMPAAPSAPQMPRTPSVPPGAVAAAAGAAGGKKKVEIEAKKASKGKFRETMWFKKGELDAAAAEAAAADAQKDPNAQTADKVDALPMEDRYNDDGSLNRGDAEKYSLRTGATSMMQAIDPNDVGRSGNVSERDLIGEMKGGRTWIWVAIVVGVIGIIGVVAALAR